MKGGSLSSRERDDMKKAIVPPYPLASFPYRLAKVEEGLSVVDADGAYRQE